MSLEVEKKFIVKNFEETLKNLIDRYGKYSFHNKSGFWFCSNLIGSENILDIQETRILKKDVDVIKDIGEFAIPVQDFQYVRLRIYDKKKYILTFKNKSMLNNIEQNTEYEFDIDSDIFKRVVFYLKETALIFYYNIKKTYEFKLDSNTKIELSKFNDLKDTYIEIETVGEEEKELFSKIDKVTHDLNNLELREEPRSYVALSRSENAMSLKRVKLQQYSKNAYKCIQDYLAGINS